MPGPENSWEWGRPDGSFGNLPGDHLRRKYNIPPDATVEAIRYRSGAYALSFYDPERPHGVWGADQEEWVDKEDITTVERLVRDPAQSGFVRIDGDEWAQTHPTIINPLIEAPGVDRAEIERLEADLRPPAELEPVGDVIFKEPGGWAELDWRVDNRARMTRAFLRKFPRSKLDVPYGFTRVYADGDSRHLGVMTPRQFAAGQLRLWGVAGRGHHEEAKRLAERCGVTLVAEEKCPMQPPIPHAGNPRYLFDYTVDGSPVFAFAMDLNKHHVYAWPGDERHHKRGWANMARLIGRDECRHNIQNWVVVEMSWKSNGTKRHDGLTVNFADRVDEAQARQSVSTVAAFLVRAGHDPEASIYYDVGGEQVEASLREAAAGHKARPAPPALQVTEAGQRLLDEVVVPYTRWRTDAPVGGTPRSRRAANELTRAARRLRGAMTEAGVEGPEMAALTRFIERRDEWAEDFGGMMAEFSLLKQKVHDLFRKSERAREVFGAGFARLFIG